MDCAEKSTNLLRELRAALLSRRQHPTLVQWCAAHGYRYETTRKALQGKRAGRISRSIVASATKTIAQSARKMESAA